MAFAGATGQARPSPCRGAPVLAEARIEPHWHHSDSEHSPQCLHLNPCFLRSVRPWFHADAPGSRVPSAPHPGRRHAELSIACSRPSGPCSHRPKPAPPPPPLPPAHPPPNPHSPHTHRREVYSSPTPSSCLPVRAPPSRGRGMHPSLPASCGTDPHVHAILSTAPAHPSNSCQTQKGPRARGPTSHARYVRATYYMPGMLGPSAGR